MKPHPALHITIPLENDPVVAMHADTYEDAQRLLLWLERSASIDALTSRLRAFLNMVQDAA